MQKSMLFIYNPKAGRGDIVLHLSEVIDRFTKNGYRVTAHPTQSRRDAYNIVLAIGNQYDCLVCSGGDGTLNEVVDALMLLEQRPMFGYLPAGSTNDFAFSLGLPDDLLLAANTVCQGIPLAIDIGQFEDDFFSYVAAFGLFTDVSYDTPQSLKNVLGHTAYVLEGVKRLTSIRSYDCRIYCDGELIEGSFIFGMITNSSTVGGFRIPLDDPTHQGDGMYSVILLKKATNLLELPNIIAALLGAEGSCDSIVVRKSRHIRVESEIPLSWTLDGEYGGDHLAADIRIHQQAIRIMTNPSKKP